MMRKCIKIVTFVMVIAICGCYVKAQNDNSSDDKTVYNMAMVEQLPEFEGGTQELYKWIADHINYPEAAVNDSVQGKVIVEFLIRNTGEIKAIKVLRPRHPALDKEAIRVVESMPNWKPGRNGGKAVNVTYTLPITFKLK